MKLSEYPLLKIGTHVKIHYTNAWNGLIGTIKDREYDMGSMWYIVHTDSPARSRFIKGGFGYEHLEVIDD